MVTDSMVECDDCGADVLDVWRHRKRTESMTHHEVRWICRECHPGVHRDVNRVSPGERVVTDADSTLAAD